MKKSLIHLAVLQTASALAVTAESAHAKVRVISLEPAAENDDAVWLKSTETIVTREMLAGTQPMLNDRKPRVQANKKPRYDKRPIHIGGGCSDIGTKWPDTGTTKSYIPDGNGIQHLAAIPTSRGPEGITKLQPAQFGQQHTGAQSAFQ